MIDLRVERNEKFRERSRRKRRRKIVRRLLALGVVAVLAAGLTLGIRSFGGKEPPVESRAPPPPPVEATGVPTSPPKVAQLAPLPREIRGVHISLGLASIPGTLDEYVGLTEVGLNTIELDVKDEEGKIGFLVPTVRLAERVGAALPYYDVEAAVEKIKSAGVYLIGRVVVFEDPILSEMRPKLAIRTPTGDVWRNKAGLGWTNPYDERVWKYNVDVAEAAAKAGFDEIMFDYVRFPSDGDVENAVYPSRIEEPRRRTISRFLQYARSRLEPRGVRISAAVFGLAATRNLGIGQNPSGMAKSLDSLYPMVYPSHYRRGEFNLGNPAAAPALIVRYSLEDFEQALREREAMIIPWLQDFSLGRRYGLTEVRAQIKAARDAGVAGFMLWNPRGVYTTAALAGP